MRVRHLSLTNFRLYARLEADLPPGLIVVQGDNAQGKTSMLEAIHYLATARSSHTATDRQLIRWGAEADDPYPYALLRANVEREDGLRLIEIALQRGDSSRLKKEIRIDRIPRRGIDLVGQLLVVMFLPGDVEVVSGAPSIRRQLLDDVLGQVDAGYVRALDRYEKAIAQRNALLKQASERRIDPDELAIWDEQLAPAAVAIARTRRAALTELSRLALPIHRELSNSLEFLSIVYQPGFDPANPLPGEGGVQMTLDGGLPGEYSDADLAGLYLRALHARRAEELARGVTLTGPHRDDFRFLANGMDLGEFGSRGQQRTSVLAFKLAQVEWMRARSGTEPVLLLDEVLAELDPHRRRCLLTRIGHSHQTIITTTDLNRFDEAFVASAQIMSVRAGVVS
jgi:DNA replication and repair protein RecF